MRERWSHTPTTVAYRPQVGPAMIAFAAAVALPVPTHSTQGEPFLLAEKRGSVVMAGRPPSLACRIPILASLWVSAHPFLPGIGSGR